MRLRKAPATATAVIALAGGSVVLQTGTARAALGA